MHPKQEELEKRLDKLCMALDNYLEDQYTDIFTLHPNRPKRGAGANPSFDGVFATSVSFTLGYGSKYGRGYLIVIDVRTLQYVSSAQREEIYNRAFLFIQKTLPVEFPERKLEIVRDGNLLKIIGDFSLGDV
jgi:hypothetical protein